ncbi:PQQ-binding-like beta-propeller repeat protein [Archangium violaceum]|uniref:WD40 repeat domain-containing protein n=1 Tax=Archangium violaceum TaxID=83451 RepID=UPI002B2BD3A6|nr:PQQ-binding-like beta-propeller repeat protein [Archangium gephyra]
MKGWKVVVSLGLAALACAWSDKASAVAVVRTLEAGGEVTSLDYDAASGLLIAGVKVPLPKPDGSCASVARVWDARSGRLLHTLKGHKRCHVDVAVANGRALLTTSDEVRVWDASTGSLQRHFGALSTLAPAALEPKQGWVATINGDGCSASIQALSSGAVLHRFEHCMAPPDVTQDHLRTLTFAPGGGLLLTVGHETVQGWDPATGNRRWSLQRNRERAFYKDTTLSHALSPDGKLLLTGGVDNAFRLWQPSTGRMLRQADHPGRSHDHTGAIAFSPDGTFFATGGESGRIHLWTQSEGKPRQTLHDERHTIVSIRFSRNGRLLAAGCSHGHVQLWDLSTGQLRHRLEGEHFVMDPPGGDLLVARPGGKLELIQVQN